MSFLDAFRRTKPTMKPRGGSGRAHTRGFLELDEQNVALAFPAGLREFDKMYRTDPDVKRVVSMTANPILGGTWLFEPYGGDEASAEDREVAEFCEWALFERMRPKFKRHLAQCLPVLFRSGFCPFEVVWTTDTWKGRTVLVPKSINLRLPRTIQRFVQEDGELVALEQLLLEGGLVELPMQDLVYYRLGAEGDNWEGTPLLRAAYKPWLLKDRIERIDAIAIEREAVGVPICYPPSTSIDDGIMDEIEEILGGLRTNDQGYIVAPGPKADHAEDGQGWLFEILSHKSTEQRSAEPSLKYHSDKIAAAFIAEFMRLGQAGEGARATADVQQDPFLAAVEAIAGEIEDTVNEQLVSRLVALNFQVDEPSKLTHSLIDSTSLVELKDYCSGLIEKGALQPDEPLEDFLRERGDLPPADPAERARRKQMRETEDQLRVDGMERANDEAPGDGPGAAPASNKETNQEKDGKQPGRKQLSRQDRPLRWYEEHMSLDEIEASIDGSRMRFELAAGAAARAAAKTLAEAARKGRSPKLDPPPELVEPLHGVLVDLYLTGRQTVLDELRRQSDAQRYGEYLFATDDEERPRTLMRRAKLAAQAVVTEAWRRVSALALIPGRNTAAELQFEAERAAMFALRQESLVHAVPALNQGRRDEADEHDEIRGSYYTSILDGNRCPACSTADDDVLRPLDDPVRLARIPPNPQCEGGSRCRCMEAFQLTSEEPPSA